MNWEIDFLNGIQNIFHSEFLDRIMPPISSLGDGGIFWILLTLVLLCIPKMRRIGLASAIALILMLISGNMILKPLIGRLRPFTENTSFVLLITAPTDFSFPSGHTFASFASATAVFKGCRKLGIPAYILAALIAFSRMYLYVHYPTDIFFGLILGILVGIIGWKLSELISRRFPKAFPGIQINNM